MNTEENTMNIEEEIKQVWHEEHIKLWAERAEKFNILNERMKNELKKSEPDPAESLWCLRLVYQALTFGNQLPEELMWKDFFDNMPNLAKEVKENYDSLNAKLDETINKQAEAAKARKAKLPWYKRWFV